MGNKLKAFLYVVVILVIIASVLAILYAWFPSVEEWFSAIFATIKGWFTKSTT